MASEVSGLIGAERSERSGERSSCRNGYRLRKALSVTPDVAERLLGHVIGGIRRVYDHHG